MALLNAHPAYILQHVSDGRKDLPAQLRGGAAAAMQSEPRVRKFFMGF